MILPVVAYGNPVLRKKALPIAETYKDLKELMLRAVPMRRFGTPEEVAKTICWLCSEEASYLNGVALPIDGGMTA